MRRESSAPARRRSGRRGMREAFAYSLAGHLCVALVLVKLGPSSSAPTASEASPVEVRVVDDHPPPTVDLTTTQPPAAMGAPAQAPRPRKRLVEMMPTASAGKPMSSEKSTAAATIPQAATPTADDEALAPPILANGEIGGAALAGNPAAAAGSGNATAPASAFGDPASGWEPGSPQWESLRAAIQRRVVYPDIARRLGWQGKVVVTFFLQKNGQVRNLHVDASSGHPPLDTSALQAVERAAPLPPAGESVQIVMPILFILR